MASKRVQLIAAHLERRPMVIMPYKGSSIEQGLARYG
jgi:hypothetical protein